jgi:hypothetical protein
MLDNSVIRSHLNTWSDHIASPSSINTPGQAKCLARYSSGLIPIWLLK